MKYIKVASVVALLFWFSQSVLADETGVGCVANTEAEAPDSKLEATVPECSDATLLDAWLKLLEESGLKSGDSETE